MEVERSDSAAEIPQTKKKKESLLLNREKRFLLSTYFTSEPSDLTVSSEFSHDLSPLLDFFACCKRRQPPFRPQQAFTAAVAQSPPIQSIHRQLENKDLRLPEVWLGV